jgi:predicted component of type VI protein secretion system
MPSLTLEIVEGPGAGRTVAVQRPLVIGRGEDADLVLDDTQVSRHHARIVPTPDGGATVEDLESSNGTFVNQQPLHSATRVDPGDQLLIGLTILQLRNEAQIAAVPSAVRPIPPALAAAQRQPSFVKPLPVAGDSGLPPELQRLRDERVRFQARTAPLAIFVLAALVVVVFLAAR